MRFTGQKMNVSDECPRCHKHALNFDGYYYYSEEISHKYYRCRWCKQYCYEDVSRVADTVQERNLRYLKSFFINIYGSIDEKGSDY